MRASRMVVTAAVAVLGLALAGCGDDDPGPDPSPETSPAETSPPDESPAGQVASCVVGEWRSTGIGGQAGGEAAGLSLNGGEGIGLSVAQDGSVSLDFARMQPVDFTGEVAGADVTGSVSYSGQASGTIRTGGEGTSGTWEPGDIDWSQVGITLDLTEPVDRRPLDNAPLGERAEDVDDLTGGLLEPDPVLADGRYECQGGDTGGDTLELTSDHETAFSWTFTRES